MRTELSISGVLLIGIVCLISSCGGTFGNSMTKVLVEAGPYAVLFPNTANEYISAGVPGKPLDGSEFTIEAWIKTNAAGTIFGRGSASATLNTDAFALSIAGDNARFSLLQVGAGTTYFVEGSDDDGDISDGQWHHVAGVLVDNAHSFHADSATCDGIARASTHIDIYVDGEFRDCGDADILTMLDFDETPDAIGADIGGALLLPTFVGTIDEVRLWRTARTEDQIHTWMEKEISGSDWDTADPGMVNIIGYWKLNEGTGDSTIDSSGYGNNGSKLLDSGEVNALGEPIFIPWMGGWVDGYPF